ncbi:MAG TPA: acyl-CoA dehydrogenase [Smithellaceae bacterium]|nr:acyl-CoA dehydrogenase [Smithellaceae bacterium]
MGNLLVNTRDQQFLLFEQFGIEKLFESEAYGGFSKDDLLMILSEAEKLAVSVIFPTLKEGDEEGCHFKNGVVTVPKCFREPFKKYSEAGWINPMDSPDVGGQGIPHTAGYGVMELFCAANYAFCMYPGLTHGAANLINVYGNEEQKKKYMEKCFSGEWTGTMCLTEPGAGSDVGALKTTAKRLPDGKFLITGTKCFISAGDHDLTPNIIHPVLARIEGDPAGTKGISIFIVPKIRVNDDGTLGEPNDVKCGGIEHKMGIKASATATLNFGEDGKCIGELLGEERAGIKIMFQMMNEARLGVGMQGVAIGSAAFQHAVAYAKERIQGTPVWEMKNPAAKAVTIINHPDVRKKLMWMKSHVEGIRALTYFGAYCMDMSKISKTEAEKANWEGYLELLTPIIKSYSTDKGLLICSTAMDVYGGYGYCSEYPVEQLMRDEKIACIYEGTNGIQALDFVGRKLGQRKGANVMNMAGLIQKTIAKYKNDGQLGKAAATLEEASNAVFEVAMFFAAAGKGGDFIAPIYNAGKYLDIFGDMVVGYLLLEGAGIAQEKLNAMYEEKGLVTIGKKIGLQRENQEAAFYAGKIASAKFFINEAVTTVKARCAAIKANDKSAMEMVDLGFTV